jgi:hypothetical protein
MAAHQTNAGFVHASHGAECAQQRLIPTDAAGTSQGESCLQEQSLPIAVNSARASVTKRLEAGGVGGRNSAPPLHLHDADRVVRRRASLHFWVLEDSL